MTRSWRLLPDEERIGRMPYVWLVYLGFFLLEPVARLRAGTMSVEYAAATVAATIVFVALYFRAYWVEGRSLLVLVVLQSLLGIALTPINPGASVFLIYAGGFAGMLRPPRTAVGAIVGTALLGAASSWLSGAGLWYWLPAVGMPLVIGYVNFHDARLREADARLRLAHEQLAAKLATRDAERAAREIRDVEQVARRALREVRETIRGYRTSLADEIAQSRSLLGAAGIGARIDAGPVPLAREAEEALALALREAVTNVVRHSGAAACEVRVREDDGGCTLVVADDGRGASAPDGSGLRGMRVRIEAMGGTVSRDAGADGRGTRVEIRLPVEAR